MARRARSGSTHSPTGLIPKRWTPKVFQILHHIPLAPYKGGVTKVVRGAFAHGFCRIWNTRALAQTLAGARAFAPRIHAAAQRVIPVEIPFTNRCKRTYPPGSAEGIRS